MEETERPDGFKVSDKRRFTTSGESRESDREQSQSQTAQQPGEAEAPSDGEHKERTGPRTQQPPPVDFSTFVVSLANTALFQMGYLKVAEDYEPEIDLMGARQTIDLLAVLEDKTRGNLNDQEKKLLTESLFQLRMAFVEASGKS